MGPQRSDAPATADGSQGADLPARASLAPGARLAASQPGQPRLLSWPELRAALTQGAPTPRIAEELPRHELDAISGVTRLQTQLLVNRGVRGREAVQGFLHADWRATETAEAASPLPGQLAAVERLRVALAGAERIIVYGDHDC